MKEIMKLNDKGIKKYNAWEKIYEMELDRLRILMDDPDYFEGWSIVDNDLFVRTFDDLIGLLVFGYGEDIGWNIEEWKTIYKPEDIFFEDVDGKKHTVEETINELMTCYEDGVE